MATVAKDFNTITQRFKVGASVSEADDLSPHSFESLKAGGFISDGAATAASPSPFSKRPVAPTTTEE